MSRTISLMAIRCIASVIACNASMVTLSGAESLVCIAAAARLRRPIERMYGDPAASEDGQNADANSDSRQLIYGTAAGWRRVGDCVSGTGT